MRNFMLQLVTSSLICASSAMGGEAETFLGPAYEPPRTSSLLALGNATANLAGMLRSTLAPNETSTQGSLQNSSSVSILVQSIYQDEPLFEFSYQAPSTHNAPISSDSVYRIGSVSKVFTVYSLLLQCGIDGFSERVVDHVPELRDYALDHQRSPASPSWTEITLGALAGQMAGIPRDYNLADLSELAMNWPSLGFPSLHNSELPHCARNESDSPCSRQAFFEGYTALPPVFTTYYTPAYSNSAFRILAYAIASIAHKPFDDLFKHRIAIPLNLTRTSLIRPSDGVGVITYDDKSWYQDLGEEAPTGGMYSSARDLSTFASAILRNDLLSDATTRRWMKPIAHTARLDFSVGMPWEIHRYTLPSQGRRVIDLYSKAGSIGTYESQLILVPDYGLSFVVLTAGTGASPVNIISNTVMDTIIPLMESAARAQAQSKFGGTYTDRETNSSILLSTDGQPGLLVEKWIGNGSDIIETASAYSQSTGSGYLESVRLFPTGLVSANQMTFRAIFETEGSNVELGAFRSNDGPWAGVDQLVYGHGAFDRFVLSTDSAGDGISLANGALRTTMIRAEKERHPRASA